MTTNWRPISARMVQMELGYRPMNHLTNQVLAYPGTDDMVAVSVGQLQRLLAGSTNRRPMEELRVDPGRLLQQLRPHMAMRQYKVDHHTIFGMQHSFLLKFNVLSKLAIVPFY